MKSREFIMLGVYEGFYLFSCNINGYGCFRLLPQDDRELKHEDPIFTWTLSDDKPKRTKRFVIDMEFFPIAFPIEDYQTV